MIIETLRKFKNNILVFLGINCYECTKEKSVIKLIPEELVILHLHPILKVKLCEKCYAKVQGEIKEIKKYAVEWDIIQTERRELQKLAEQVEKAKLLKEAEELGLISKNKDH